MKLRKLKKGKARNANDAALAAAIAAAAASLADSSLPDPGTRPETAAPPEAGAGSESEAADRAEEADRAEAVEAMYQAALTRAEIAEAKEQAAAERLATAEAAEAEAAQQVEAAEARVRSATEQAVAAEAREQAVIERIAALQAREEAVAERIAAVQAREHAAAERDAIANERDRAAVARATIANERDRAAAERDATMGPRLAARLDTGEGGSGDDELERARLEAQLQRAHLDSLTGAFRREMGRLALRNEIERARRADGRFVVAFVDVDGLKGVNDREGHAAGDKILRTLAATMRANLRSYDPIVRYGGDEFVCGIASIEPDEVQHRIGVIDQSLRNATGVGITAGLATLEADESLEELTARADAALVEAKRSRDA